MTTGIIIGVLATVAFVEGCGVVFLVYLLKQHEHVRMDLVRRLGHADSLLKRVEK